MRSALMVRGFWSRTVRLQDRSDIGEMVRHRATATKLRVVPLAVGAARWFRRRPPEPVSGGSAVPVYNSIFSQSIIR